MEYRYRPQGVCSREFLIDIDDNDIIKSVKIVGGCAGNTAGISMLVEGMKVEDVIKKLKGIPCGPRKTSCPDQLALALEEIIESRK